MKDSTKLILGGVIAVVAPVISSKLISGSWNPFPWIRVGWIAAGRWLGAPMGISRLAFLVTTTLALVAFPCLSAALALWRERKTGGYTEDRFHGRLYRWKWRIGWGVLDIVDLKEHCPFCECRLIDMRCPNCRFDAAKLPSQAQDEVEALILRAAELKAEAKAKRKADKG